MFTRQHYFTVVRLVRDTSGPTPDTMHKSKLVAGLALLFMRDNPRFDYDRFKKECS